MTLSLKPAHTRSIALFAMLVALFLAPPVLLVDVQPETRQTALAVVFPCALIAVAAFFIPFSRRQGTLEIDVSRRFFANRFVGYFVLIAGCSPLLLAVPTLNGWLEPVGLGFVPLAFAWVGEMFVPAIRGIAVENGNTHPPEEILQAQAVHAYAYFSFIVLTLPATIRLCLMPDTSFIYRNADRTVRFKFFQSRLGSAFVILLFALLSWLTYFGWGVSSCTGTRDYLIYVNCALGDDLLLFINAHGTGFMLSLCFFAIISSIWNLKEAIGSAAPARN